MNQRTKIVVRFPLATLPSLLLLFACQAHTHADEKNVAIGPSLQKTSQGEAAEGGHDVATQLWHGNRITPEQPFPARVIGVIPSWVGYALLLEEIAEKPRYCVAYLWKTQKLEYRIVAGKEAFKEVHDAAKATYLSSGVEVDHFSWSIGVDIMGRRFGEQDFVTQWYPKWTKRAEVPADGSADDDDQGEEAKRLPANTEPYGAASRKLAVQFLVAAGMLDEETEFAFARTVSPLHTGFARIDIHEPWRLLPTVDGGRVRVPGDRKRAYHVTWNTTTAELAIDLIPPSVGYGKHEFYDMRMPKKPSSAAKEFRWKQNPRTGEVTVEPAADDRVRHANDGNKADTNSTSDRSAVELQLDEAVGLTLLPLDKKAGTLVSETPVTNAQYAVAVKDQAVPAPTIPSLEHERWVPEPPADWREKLTWNGRNPPVEFADAAVLFVTTEESLRYCRWLNEKSSEYEFRILKHMEWQQKVGFVTNQDEIATKFHPGEANSYYVPRRASGRFAIRTDIGMLLAPQTVELLSVPAELKDPVAWSRRLGLRAGTVSDNGRPSTTPLHQGRYSSTSRGYSHLLLPSTFHVVASPTNVPK